MSATPIKRKLAAILAADAVGYSRLMAEDEEGTMRILAAHRAMIDGIIELQEGRIVNTAGDSVIAEFESPVQAVRCAVEIQDALRTRNDSLPEDKRLVFRIGVNLGDVMVKGDDLLGDGVNVAARLESVADPGGICVSSSVYDQIAGKLDLGFVDVGHQSLKNIDRPVRVYRVDRDGGRRLTVQRRPATIKWLLGLAVIAALAAAWHFALVPMQEAARRAEAETAAKSAAEERQRQEMLAQAQAETEKLRAAAVATKQQAETELGRQRAAAEAAKRRADTQAAAATEAKRALEAQQAATVRERQNAELARLRVEAEEAKRKAAELAAAEEARRSAETKAAAPARTVVPSLREGRWAAEISCPPTEKFPARSITASVSSVDDVFIVQARSPGQPGSLTLKGKLNSDGTVSFGGTGIAGRRGDYKQYRAGFSARPVSERYEGSGRLGGRECSIVLSRLP